NRQNGHIFAVFYFSAFANFHLLKRCSSSPRAQPIEAAAAPGVVPALEGGGGVAACAVGPRRPNVLHGQCPQRHGVTNVN
ncbi:MAG: hypothetical protein AAGF99_18800, partial [Bacteroidota bacterium]